MKKIGVGFVGAGWMGGMELRRLAERDDVELLALLEPHAERGKEALAAVGLAADLLVSGYDSIIENGAIDAVWLVSPNSFHGDQALRAMKAGKHVFCEKPPATTFRDFCAEIEAERANPHLITFVDYILYFDPMECRLREMAAKGAFGTITQVQVNYRHPVNISGEKVWKLSKEIMGDAIGMGIIHALSIILWSTSSQARPVSVYATSMEARVRGFEADAVWNILVKFDNGATGFCFGNIDVANGYDAYHNVYGTEGGFIFDSQQDQTHKVRYWSKRLTDGQWVFPLDGRRCQGEGKEALAWPPEMTTPDSGDVIHHQTAECAAHFIECIKTGKKSPLSFERSAPIAEVGWAAQVSAATGREVRLPLNWEDARAFFND